MDDDKVFFPFGYGLSYGKTEYLSTTFTNSVPVLDSRLYRKSKSQEPIHLQTRIANNGDQDIDEAVQVYMSAPGADAAKSQLIAFRKVTLKAGAEQTVEFDIQPSDLATVQADGRTTLVKGTYTIRVGASAPGKRADELGVSHADATIIVK